MILNLNLGSFNWIKALLHQSCLCNIDYLIRGTVDAFVAITPEALINTFLLLQKCMESTTKVEGRKNYSSWERKSLQCGSITPFNSMISSCTKNTMNIVCWNGAGDSSKVNDKSHRFIFETVNSTTLTENCTDEDLLYLTPMQLIH